MILGHWFDLFTLNGNEPSTRKEAKKMITAETETLSSWGFYNLKLPGFKKIRFGSVWVAFVSRHNS